MAITHYTNQLFITWVLKFIMCKNHSNSNSVQTAVPKLQLPFQIHSNSCYSWFTDPRRAPAPTQQPAWFQWKRGISQCNEWGTNRYLHTNVNTSALFLLSTLFSANHPTKGNITQIHVTEPFDMQCNFITRLGSSTVKAEAPHLHAIIQPK